MGLPGRGRPRPARGRPADRTYDGAGNLVSDGARTYSWDWRSRLVQVSGAGGGTYAYDGDGLRVRSEGRAVLWDRNAEVPTILDDGDATYVHGPGGLATTHDGSEASYPLTDALASVRALTDAAGVVTGRTSYRPFGGVRTATGDQAAFGFTGEVHDRSGLVYLRARHLEPGTGRFLSVDPVRPGGPGAAGYNPYAYVAGNPTTWTDPTGREAAVSYARLVAVAAPRRPGPPRRESAHRFRPSGSRG